MPNEGTARHRRSALPIGTDRNGGGCKAGTEAGAMSSSLRLKHARRKVVLGSPDKTRAESPRSLGGHRAAQRDNARRHPSALDAIEARRLLQGIAPHVEGRRELGARMIPIVRPDGVGHDGIDHESRRDASTDPAGV